MNDTPVELVLSKLPNAKRSGKGWSAKCPTHDDRRPSLTITEGGDRQALLHCHAGCSVEEICAALGLTMRDLMSSTSTQLQNPRKKRQCRRHGQEKTRNSKTCSTANAMVRELERQHGNRSAMWTYRNAEGEQVGAIVRWDTPAGKDILPIARNGDGRRDAGAEAVVWPAGLGGCRSGVRLRG